MNQQRFRDDGFIVRVLAGIFGSQKELASRLEISQAYVSRLGARLDDHNKHPWSDVLIAKAIAALSQLKPPIVLEPMDWQLDETDFEQKIARQRFGVSQDAEGRRIPRIDRFHGRFIRLYLKPTTADFTKMAVHFGDFFILPSDSDEEARVEFRSFRHDLENDGERERLESEFEIPAGYLKIIDRTLEMSVEYGTDLPKSLYLGPRPVGSRVNWFLMMNLDIIYVTHHVCANPMLFVRVQECDRFPFTPVGAESTLFEKVQTFLVGVTKYREESFELLFKSSDEASIKDVLLAMNELKSNDSLSSDT